MKAMWRQIWSIIIKCHKLVRSNYPYFEKKIGYERHRYYSQFSLVAFA